MRFRFPPPGIVAIGLGLTLSACASAPKGPVELAVQATVTNNTGKPIAKIEYQPCGAGASEWAGLPFAGLASGATARVALPAACVNLRAFNSDSKVVGTQQNVKREFPFTWYIS